MFDKGKMLRDACLRSVYNYKVLVIGGGYQYIKMFHDAGFKGASNIDDADILCFTGGHDVDPALYGEKPIPGTGFNRPRDDKEAFLYGYGLEKPKIGICRGAQFLNVMNGGKLWQDVDNHAIGGFHAVTDIKTGEVIQGMTSTHHQQMIPTADATLIACAELSLNKSSDGYELKREVPALDDAEVVWYDQSLSLCFQPHPEFNEGLCQQYFLSLVDEYILPAC